MTLLIATCPDCGRVVRGGCYREINQRMIEDRADWEAHGLIVFTTTALTVQLRRHADNCPRRKREV